MPQPIGLVLAGGAGRRLGVPKGGLDYHGVPLARRAACALMPLCRQVAVSVAPATLNPAPEFATIEDAPPGGRGPLSGLDAAFRAYPGEDLLVLACDYPRVETELLRMLAERTEAGDQVVLAEDGGGRRHPLVALWRAAAAAPVAAAVGAGRPRVGAVLERLRVRSCGAAAFPGLDLDRLLLNVNRPADLQALDD